MSDEWSLGNEEVGKACAKITRRSKTAKVYLPKAMPLVKSGKPKKKSKPIKKSCFSNAKKCKPSVASKVRTKNYIDIPIATDTRFKASSGKKLKINVKHNDIDQLTVGGRADKSMK